MKWSEYYERTYNLGTLANLPGDTLAKVNESIRNAQQYEAGAISKDEFAYRMRAIDASHRSAEQQRLAAQQAQADANLAVAAQLMQASGPRPIAQPAVYQQPGGVLMGFLQTQSVNGTLRYCRYSNGIVTTISSVSLCPLNTGQ